MLWVILEGNGQWCSPFLACPLDRFADEGLVAPVDAVKHADGHRQGPGRAQEKPSIPKTFFGWNQLSSSRLSTIPTALSLLRGLSARIHPSPFSWTRTFLPLQMSLSSPSANLIHGQS